MSQPADAVNCNYLPRARARVSQRVVDSYSRAHKGPCFFCRQFIGNSGERCCRSNHVFGIAAVKIDASDFAIDAHREVTAPARLARETVSAVPADAHALSCLPCGHAVAQGVDASGDFVTRHARILKPGPDTFFD